MTHVIILAHRAGSRGNAGKDVRLARPNLAMATLATQPQREEARSNRDRGGRLGWTGGARRQTVDDRRAQGRQWSAT